MALLARSCHVSLITTIEAMPFSPEQIQMHIDMLLPRCISAIEHNLADNLTP